MRRGGFLFALLAPVALLVLPACGVRKSAEDSAVRLQRLSDSAMVRLRVDRQRFDYGVVREVRLSAPDSTGRQFVTALRVTQRVAGERDSVRLDESEGVVDQSIEMKARSTSQTTMPSSFAILLFVGGVFIVFVIGGMILLFGKRLLGGG